MWVLAITTLRGLVYTLKSWALAVRLCKRHAMPLEIEVFTQFSEIATNVARSEIPIVIGNNIYTPVCSALKIVVVSI
eukprot:scaffold310040_cov19-Prasinocladus_malaysianus.AAC.1